MMESITMTMWGMMGEQKERNFLMKTKTSEEHRAVGDLQNSVKGDGTQQGKSFHLSKS